MTKLMTSGKFAINKFAISPYFHGYSYSFCTLFAVTIIASSTEKSMLVDSLLNSRFRHRHKEESENIN